VSVSEMASLALACVLNFLQLFFSIFIALMIETVRTSETSVCSETTRCYIPQKALIFYHFISISCKDEDLCVTHRFSQAQSDVTLAVTICTRYLTVWNCAFSCVSYDSQCKQGLLP
jgi:hypothetical protein